MTSRLSFVLTYDPHEQTAHIFRLVSNPQGSVSGEKVITDGLLLLLACGTMVHCFLRAIHLAP